MVHPQLTSLSANFPAEVYEAGAWGALVVALFCLIAGAPIMAKFWLKPPPQQQPPVEQPPAEQAHQPDS